MNTLNIYTLGGLAINLNDAPLSGLSSRKAKALLVYLAYTGRPHLRQSLATFLWGEGEERQLVANLRRELTDLRRYLSPYVQLVDETVSFSSNESYCMDVMELKAALTIAEEKQTQSASLSQDDATQIERAMVLYQGEFLEGFPPNTSRYFDNWLHSERTQLHQRVTAALHSIVSTYLEAGAYTAAIAQATRLIQLDTLDEEAHYQLMVALAQTGQRQAALAHYESYAAHLDNYRRGDVPGASLTALYQKIQNRRLSSANGQSKPRHNLPPEPNRFIGRSAELHQIAERLNDPACRLLTLVGIGEIGKTRLALKAAASQVECFAEGVYFVPLISVTGSENITKAVAGAIDFTPGGTGDDEIQVLAYLANKHMLLVLDSFEHLLKGTDLLVRILAHAPQVKILVTSQQELGLYEEWLLPVQGFCTDGDSDTSAVELFIQSAHKVQPGLSVEENSEHIKRLCQLVDGMPLAIELAAAWSRQMSLPQIIDQVEHDLSFLTARWTNVPERHRNLRVLLECSWELLSPGEGTTLMRLAVFSGAFDSEAAMQVAQATLPMLASLVGKSLLQRAPTSDRYTMHNLIRQYVREKLVESGQIVQILNHHLTYFAEFAEAAEPKLSGADQGIWLDRLDAEHDNLEAALVWSCREGSEAEWGARLAGALWPFWRIRGYLHKGRYWLDLLQANAPAPWRAKLLTGAGMLTYVRGDYLAASRFLTDCLTLHEQAANEAGIAATLDNLGIVAREQGDYPLAETYHQRSLELSRELKDRAGMAESCNNLGLALLYQMDYGRANRLFDEARRLWEEAHNIRGLARVLNNLGLTAFYQANFQTADRLCQESLRRFESLGDTWGRTIALINVGRIALEQKDFKRTAFACQQSLILSCEIDYPENIAECLEVLSALFFNTERTLPSVRFLSMATHLRDNLGAPLPPADRASRDAIAAALLSAVEATDYTAAWAEGQQMQVKTALEQALEFESPT